VSQPNRIVIVGGVAGGASAAARCRRLSEEVEIVLLERGRDISFANCGLPYHIGEIIADRDRLLVQTAGGMRKRFGIEVRTRHEVVRIDRSQKQVVVRDLDAGTDKAEPYDALILSPGAEPVRPKIPGADGAAVFTLRSLHDMDRIKALVDQQRPDRAVVVGGGYIGLEMTEALCGRGIGVTLVELARQVFVAADAEMVAPIHQQLQQHGVDLRLGTSVTAIRPVDGQGQEQGQGASVLLSTGETVACGLVILAVGVRPEAHLAREAGLEIGATGGIAVDEHMRTSDPAIFAVGDAVEVTHLVSGQKVLLPLAGPANRQGRIAADNALGRNSVYRYSQGTAICKVFDQTIAMTGLSEKTLQKAGMAYEKVYVHPASHAGYYPGASPISLKLLFDPGDGRVLGAQAVGSDGVDKRIDVLAVAIRAGMTVEDLCDLELAYAPPYGSARDPVNYAGFVAANVRAGDVKLCHVEDVLHPGEDQLLLDVRTPAEVAAGTIPGARNIPLDELRGRLGELPAGREVLAFCQVGLRGYLACRILSQHGLACRNLTGGYKTYKAATDMLKAAEPPPPPPAEDTGESAEAMPVPPQSVGGAAGPGRGCNAGPVERTDRTDRTDTTDTTGPSASAASATAPATAVAAPQVVRTIDARGLQCPGPILRLKAELDALADGQALSITATDCGFPADVEAWCRSTGNELLSAARDNGTFHATVVRRVRPAAATATAAAAAAGAGAAKKTTMVVFSGDFDKAVASFIIANGAAAMGQQVTMFFTFWGINVLRKAVSPPVRKNLIERMFGWMMPRGADKLGLSKMNMGGMGLRMIKGIMRKKNVAGLPDLIESARRAGVRLVACSMSMDLMGLRREELIDGVEEGGVAMYLDSAEAGAVNLFI
jgi:NADPH-dependent 2,4-dienoyl-CoA reductase/sulfur reductase-like enzyme/peroxiredoxin family protein/rhodanese-related sulfurtransferase/TusA-related sulfurtransferase